MTSGDVQLGAIVMTQHADREVGQHDGQEAACPVEGVGQCRCAEHCAAAQELETAGPHRHREQAEGFVLQFADQQVVQRGVAVYRHATGCVCKIDVEAREQRCCVDVAMQHAGQHATHETH